MQISSRRFGVSDQVRHTMKDRRRWEKDDQSRFCRIWERSIVGCRNVVKKNSRLNHKILGPLCRSCLSIVVPSPGSPTPKSLRIIRRARARNVKWAASDAARMGSPLVRTKITLPTPGHRRRFFFTPTGTCARPPPGVKIFFVSSDSAQSAHIALDASRQLLRYHT